MRKLLLICILAILVGCDKNETDIAPQVTPQPPPPQEGSIMWYKYVNGTTMYASYDLYVDGQKVAVITKSFYMINCGNDDCYTMTSYDEGWHTYEVRRTGYNTLVGSGGVALKQGQCHQIIIN